VVLGGVDGASIRLPRTFFGLNMPTKGEPLCDLMARFTGAKPKKAPGRLSYTEAREQSRKDKHGKS
jgi:hypothetical protein